MDNWYGDLQAYEKLKNNSICIIKNIKGTDVVCNMKSEDDLRERRTVFVSNCDTAYYADNNYIDPNEFVRYKPVAVISL